MPFYPEMTKERLEEALKQDRAAFEAFRAAALKLDMSRGKPGADQLDLSNEICGLLSTETGFESENGTDVRNYGIADGLPESKRLFAEIFEVPADRVIVGGNSSLNMMYDTVAYCHTHGVLGSTPWGRLPKVKFLCPAPGYDRHFAVTEFFGYELIPVAMTDEGPDMDQVAELAKDETVKGIWCVPRYSNPTGITYSDRVVRAFAETEFAAEDFRIFWDDAYCVHDLYDEPDPLLSILKACAEAGHPERAFVFASTSKISWPGAGVAAMAAGPESVRWLKNRLTVQTIGPDKTNQLRHARMFPDLDAVRRHMKKHAALLRPKFETVLSVLDRELADTGLARWNKPRGGYFVSVDVTEGTAQRVVRLCKEAGVVLTPAGATYPGGKDPFDRNIRLAPTFPPLSELKTAIEVFCVCVRIAGAEKLLERD